MKTKQGLFLHKGIYYSIVYDHHEKNYCSYFVHNNIAKHKSSRDFAKAKNVCVRNKGLHVTVTIENKIPKMLLWHYEVFNKKVSYLKTVTEQSIDQIRDWETQVVAAISS